MRVAGLIFAASPTGNRVVAHNTSTQTDQPIVLNATKESPIEVSFGSGRFVVGLNLKGSHITRTAVYDWRGGLLGSSRLERAGERIAGIVAHGRGHGDL